MTESDGWKGCYELYTGEKDQTTFAPINWPEDDDGSYSTYFMLAVEEGDVCSYWLSNSIGIANSPLCLQFMVKREFTGLTAKEHKNRLHNFYNNTPALSEAGFLITKSGVIYRPFAFDARILAEEYPDFDETFATLDAALEDLFKALPDFDKLVKELSK